MMPSFKREGAKEAVGRVETFAFGCPNDVFGETLSLGGI
jgi:hypothetical protein